MAITTDELYELADRTLNEARPVAGGVALPGNIDAGAIVSPARARQLAAQLLLAADEYDEIQDLALAPVSDARVRGFRAERAARSDGPR